MKCPNCNGESGGKFCQFCGSEMPYQGPDTVINDNRTTIINNNTYNQMVVINEEEPAPTFPLAQKLVPGQYKLTSHSEKDRQTALVLCIVFGWCGAHYFYVGRREMGILYLLTLGLAGIGWMVDIVRIALGVFPDSMGLNLVD